MPNRLLFALITLFWVCMNVLLWRSEFKGAGEFGSSIPAGVVWEKMLTAPDDSTLEITQNGRKIGYFRWRPNVGEELTMGKVGTDKVELEGMVKRLSGYHIDVEGSVMLEKWEKRFRFSLQGDFETNFLWKEITARVTARPNQWEVRSVSADETLSIRSESEGSKWERQFSFGDLRNPATLFEEFGGPMLPMLLRQWGLGETNSRISLGVEWEGRNSSFPVGHSSIRVYRLEARLFDRYRMAVIVSRVGEILRIELPNEIVLLNETFVGL